MQGDSGLAKCCIMLVAIAVAGCAALQPLPHSARPGDTIALAVGSPEGLTRMNTVVTFTPDSDPVNPVDLSSNIVAIFNASPDN